MAKLVTLRLNSDFRRAYGRGKSRADSYLVSYALKNRTGVCRYGITTSKKIGCAVERNRCRRIIRAAFAELSGQCGSWDLVFVARGRTTACTSTQIAQSMRKQLAQLGVLQAGERI